MWIWDSRTVLRGTTHKGFEYECPVFLEQLSRFLLQNFLTWGLPLDLWFLAHTISFYISCPKTALCSWLQFSPFLCCFHFLSSNSHDSRAEELGVESRAFLERRPIGRGDVPGPYGWLSGAWYRVAQVEWGPLSSTLKGAPEESAMMYLMRKTLNRLQIRQKQTYNNTEYLQS